MTTFRRRSMPLPSSWIQSNEWRRLIDEDEYRVVAQFRSGHGPISVLFECYRIRTDSGMPRLDIRFSTSHLMMASTR